MEATRYQKFADEMNRRKEEESTDKTASDYMRTRQSKSKRYVTSTTKRKFVSKGFGGSTRRKKI